MAGRDCRALARECACSQQQLGGTYFWFLVFRAAIQAGVGAGIGLVAPLTGLSLRRRVWQHPATRDRLAREHRTQPSSPAAPCNAKQPSQTASRKCASADACLTRRSPAATACSTSRTGRLLSALGQCPTLSCPRPAALIQPPGPRRCRTLFALGSPPPSRLPHHHILRAQRKAHLATRIACTSRIPSLS